MWVVFFCARLGLVTALPNDNWVCRMIRTVAAYHLHEPPSDGSDGVGEKLTARSGLDWLAEAPVHSVFAPITGINSHASQCSKIPLWRWLLGRKVACCRHSGDLTNRRWRRRLPTSEKLCWQKSSVESSTELIRLIIVPRRLFVRSSSVDCVRIWKMIVNAVFPEEILSSHTEIRDYL